jgi:hypothetical protein
MYTVCTPTELNRKTLIFTPNKPPSSTFLQLTHAQSHMLVIWGFVQDDKPSLSSMGKEDKERKRKTKERGSGES